MEVDASSDISDSKDPYDVRGRREEESSPDKNLLETLGGQVGITTAVEKFYDRILRDSRVNGYFVNVDMDILRKKQVRFMQHALLEGADLMVDEMRRVHAPLDPPLDLGHFTVIVAHFVGALSDIGVTDDLIEVAVAKLSPLSKAFGVTNETII